MSEEKKVQAGAAAEAPVKKARRGVSNETQATAQLRFHERDAAPNGLFIAHLHRVSVEWSQNADGKQFTGEKVPRLVFEFCSNTSDASQMRHVYQSLFPVESNVNTIPDGSEEWKVNQVLNWIKHILDVYYLKGRNLTEAEVEALTLPFVDFDDEGNFVPLDVKEIIDGYAFIFNNAAAMLNGTFGISEGETPKPCYKTAEGKPIRCWIKLLRHKKVKGEWKNVNNGDLGFDSFIGTGAVEIMTNPNDMPKTLSIDLAKESITPKEVKKAPTIPGVAGGAVVVGDGMMAGAGMAGPGMAGGGANADDLPW